MRAHFAYGIKYPFPIKKASTLRSYSDSKKELLSVGLESKTIPFHASGSNAPTDIFSNTSWLVSFWPLVIRDKEKDGDIAGF